MFRRAMLAVAIMATMAGAQETPKYRELVDANNRFAFKFLHQVLKQGAEKNVLVSPLSLTLDFAFLSNGTDWATRNELAQAFEFGSSSQADMNTAALELLKALDYKTATPKFATGEELLMSRSLWTTPDGEFRPRMVELGKDFYDIHLSRVKDNGPAAADAVNQWISKKTGGVFTNVVSDWKGDDFLLVDTTLFNGKWEVPFPPSQTRPSEFMLLSGQKKTLPFMRNTAHYQYLESDNFQAIQLSYYHGTMYVFLPTESSNIRDFETQLTAANWLDWKKQFIHREGTIEMPKFATEYRDDVATALEGLGLERIFHSFASLAPAITKIEGGHLTQAVQAINFDVDEIGVKVTSVGVVGGVVGGIAARRPPPFHMVVNRPFFFTICDSQTGAILYMGVVVDPR